jgi:hypothetical protein
MMRRALGVVLAGVLLSACGEDVEQAAGTTRQAAAVCTCQWTFDQDGVLLGFPAPTGCALVLDSGGTPGPLAACSDQMGDRYLPPPAYHGHPRQAP